MTSAIHRESLARIPLVKQLLSDGRVRLLRRRIDQRWKYEGVLRASFAGFNPLASAVFYPARSRLAAWLANPFASARKHNEGDLLVPEVLFAVHDYLHAWAYLAINELRPSLGFGTRRLTQANAEDFVFCHLLTEAVATVGLDYWYLSATDLNRVCDIGTTQRTLTVGYDERSLSEYRKFNPGFEVQTPSFFAHLADFYQTGIFHGFDLRALRQSPRVLRWLRHELSYGELQRRYIRLWLSYLSNGTVTYAASQLDASVSVGEKWKTQLTRAIGELLWDKVKRDHTQRFSFRFDEDRVWRAREDGRLDFRFLNANRISDAAALKFFAGGANGAGFDVYLNQYLVRHDHRKIDRPLLELLPTLVQKKDVSLVHYLFANQPLVDGGAEQAPRDLFVLS